MRRLTLIGAMALSVVLVLAASEARAQQGHAARRERAAVLMRQGNWNEALTLLRALVENAGNDRVLVAQDLTSAVSCLGRLGRTHEIDALVEAAVKAHPKSWRLSLAAARAYNSGQHYGYLVAGEFHRGHHRGGGKYVMSYERDRRRALQLMSGALPAVADEPDRAAAFTFYYEFAQALARTVSGGSAWDAWRLQSLSDLDALPDYVERRRYYHRGYANRGAPADPDGSPVLHEVPRGWDAAKTDGERWRWLLVMAQEVAPERTGEILMHRAQFAHQQFGVQTMVYGRRYGRAADDAKGAESGPYAVRTLGEDETIARLAVGIKRFTLPADHNHIRLCQRILDEGRDSWRVQAAQLLASAFENRQQYTRAVEYWRIVGNRERVDQIIGNWGQFEALVAQPAGGGAEVEYRFRNAKAVTFEAFAIDTEALLADIKEYIRAEPPRLDHRKVQLQRWGVELIDGNKQRYVGRNVASWGMPLEPRPGHFDRRITVQTPLREPGAYLLSAHMSGGNVSSVVVWVADTVIVKKPLVNETMVYVADAVTGRPIDSAEVSVFGYRQEWRRGTRTYDIRTRDVSLRTDMDGIAYFEERDSSRYRWVITARTPGGRFAYQGWSSFWRGSRYDAQYHATRAFVMTDRPVYRPAQPVRFKAWVAEAKYDLEGGSRFASQRFRVKIHTPKGDVAFDKTLEADRFGGVASEWESPKDATLGMYRVTVEGSHVRGGSGWFRVEEYKKPEYEVKIEAPDEPVMLGDKVEATVTSTYYFGGPVTHGRIKYKVMRTTHAATWYPPRYWDWFYGPGYWWYAYDYDWYPGWGRWGCRRPWPWWWSRPQPQPEVVLENECELGADGTVKIEIDTALAEAMLGDSDHRYDITAEVTDQSRRTIVGTGRVLVAREPFKVYAWVDRGHYRTGDTVAASFSAFTLDHKPVVGRGRLSLYKVSYGRDMTPVESVVETWDLHVGRGDGPAAADGGGARAVPSQLRGHRRAGSRDGGGVRLHRLGSRLRRIGISLRRLGTRHRQGRVRARRPRAVDGEHRPRRRGRAPVRPSGERHRHAPAGAGHERQERTPGRRDHEEGHAELLRRGAHRAPRQSTPGDARDHRPARGARLESGDRARQNRVPAGRGGQGDASPERAQRRAVRRLGGRQRVRQGGRVRLGRQQRARDQVVLLEVAAPTPRVHRAQPRARRASVLAPRTARDVIPRRVRADDARPRAGDWGRRRRDGRPRGKRPGRAAARRGPGRRTHAGCRGAGGGEVGPRRRRGIRRGEEG